MFYLGRQQIAVSSHLFDVSRSVCIRRTDEGPSPCFLLAPPSLLRWPRQGLPQLTWTAPGDDLEDGTGGRDRERDEQIEDATDLTHAIVQVVTSGSPGQLEYVGRQSRHLQIPHRRWRERAFGRSVRDLESRVIPHKNMKSSL